MSEEKTIYTVRIVYKSGYTHDFEVYSIDGTRKPTTGLAELEWEAVDKHKSPMFLGIDDVSAVWIIGSRKRN